jgi:two-component system, response regulator
MTRDQNIVEILLVEDNPKDLELTLHALRKHNLANNIAVARDGQEALYFLFGKEGEAPNGKARVILLDLKLPKFSGLEVLARIKADERTKHTPVVVLTSSTSEADLKECYRLGVNSYLAKPVDFSKFLEMAGTIGLYWLLMNKVPPK